MTVSPNVNGFTLGASGLGGTDELGGFPVSILNAASATGTANAAAPNVAPSAGNASATATAPTVSANPGVNPTAAVATATGTSAAPTIAANGGLGSATATAQTPTSSVQPAAGLASATATGQTPGVSVSGATGVATGTATGNSPGASIAVHAGLASATASAPAPVVSTSASVSAVAGLATATATAQPATPSLGPAPAAATTTATGRQPSAGVGPSPGFAVANASANNPTISTSGNAVTANAGLAEATATAYDATVLVPVRHFTPPTDQIVGPVNPDTEPNSHGYRLRGHYSSAPCGRNVWKISQGVYSEHQPYPLITPEQVKNGEVPINGISAPTYVYVYYGGHSYEVNDQEAADLVAAGYAVS